MITVHWSVFAYIIFIVILIGWYLTQGEDAWGLRAIFCFIIFLFITVLIGGIFWW